MELKKLMKEVVMGNAASVKDLKGAFRADSIKAHPDKGGTSEDFKFITKLKERIEKKMKKRGFI